MKRKRRGGGSLARSWLGDRPGTGQEPDGVLLSNFVRDDRLWRSVHVCVCERKRELSAGEWSGCGSRFDQEHLASEMK